MSQPDAQVSVFWLAGELGELPAGEDWLGEREREVLAGLRLPKRRREWLLGRWTAKRALRGAGRLPQQLTDAEAEVLAAADGAPEVFVAGEQLSVTLSITHRAALSVCAVSDGQLALGCDLELVEPRSEAFVRDYFTAAEQRLIAEVDQPRRALATTLIWSAKESTLKALRTGLRRDTRSVEVTLDGAQPTPTAAWLALSVRDTATHERYHGFWRTIGEMVVTVVANTDGIRLLTR